MKKDPSSIYKTLHAIYDKHRRQHRENPDSKQMCCMWSTNDPPDIIEGTDPICDIEEAFDIEISDDEALELYEMKLDEAAQKIVEIRKRTGKTAPLTRVARPIQTKPTACHRRNPPLAARDRE